MERRSKSKFVTVLQTCLRTGTLDALAALLISYKIPPLYGLVIWIIMNYTVLPITNIPKGNGRLELISLLKGIAALIICVGLPVALIADKEINTSTIQAAQ